MNFQIKFFISLIVLIITHNIQAQSENQKISPEEYINTYKNIAIEKMLEYKIPASITLAQGLLESGNGNSRLAVQANNHFGIKCHMEWTGETFIQDDDAKNECFRKYKNPNESFKDHSLFLSTRNRYAFLFDLDIKNYKAWAKGLKKAGYATNPKYPQLLINLIERYELYKYDNAEKKIIADKEKRKKKENKNQNQTTNISSQKKPINSSTEEQVKISITGRKISTNNRIKFIIAKENDNIHDICQELDMFRWQITKYNELADDATLKEGQIIYIQPKRRKAERRYHTVKKGETLYSISQKYGVKQKFILKKNSLQSQDELKPGLKLYLRKTKPE